LVCDSEKVELLNCDSVINIISCKGYSHPNLNHYP